MKGERNMNTEKKSFVSAEIKIVLLDRDLLTLSSNDTLEENGWDFFNFEDL